VNEVYFNGLITLFSLGTDDGDSSSILTLYTHDVSTSWG